MSERFFMHRDSLERCRTFAHLLEVETISRRPEGGMSEEQREKERKLFQKRQGRLSKGFDYMLNSLRFPPPVVVDHHLRIGFHISECSYDFGTHRLTYTPNVLAKLVGYAGIHAVPRHLLTHPQPCPTTMDQLDSAPYYFPILFSGQALPVHNHPPTVSQRVDSPTVTRKDRNI